MRSIRPEYARGRQLGVLIIFTGCATTALGIWDAFDGGVEQLTVSTRTPRAAQRIRTAKKKEKKNTNKTTKQKRGGVAQRIHAANSRTSSPEPDCQSEKGFFFFSF